MAEPTNFAESNLFLIACEGDLEETRRAAAKIEQQGGDLTLEYIRRGAAFLLKAISPNVDLAPYLEGEAGEPDTGTVDDIQKVAPYSY